MTLTAQENTDGAWAGPGRSGGGSNYDEWKFYDNSNLAQCFDKECSSGEGKKFVLYHFNDTQNNIFKQKQKSYKHQIFAAKGYDSNCATIPVLENDYNNAPDSCAGRGYSCKTKEEVLALKTTAEADCETDKQDCTNF